MLTACNAPKSSLTYFEDLSGTQSGTLPSTDYEIKLRPDDELLITVTSLVPEATAEYNLPLSNPATQNNIMTPSQGKQQTYIVDKSGDIKFPGIGMLHVDGMTTSQLASLLVKKISAQVEDPYVKVVLVNFRINVMGEVNRPGSINVNRERYSILDALADAGDLTQYGERDNILLVREENDGTKTFHHLNLNDSELLSSPYFYLQQNDVVCVNPNKIRKDNSKYNQNNAFKLSVVSAVTGACSVIASLIIALVIR